MSEPALYRRYTRDEAIALFGPADLARSLCDGQWVVLPEHVLCLAAVGTPPGLSHFPSASRFCWAADRPYRVTGGEEWDQNLPSELRSASNRWDEFLPREVRSGRERDLPIHLFAHGTDDDGYLHLGRLRPSHTWGSGSPGRNFGEAYFDLSPSLPSRTWAELGGLRTQGLDHRLLDCSLARLGPLLPLDERLGILRQAVEYWHGPVGPEDGLPEAELAACRLPLPLRWWYALAGRRRGLVDGFNHLLGPRQLTAVGDGLVLFLSENQGGYGWATLAEGEDPPVWGSIDGIGPWVNEGMTLSEFLIQACLFEAVNTTAPYHASAGLDAAGVDRLSAVAPPLALAPWHWPVHPTTFHAGSGAFLMVQRYGGASENQSFSVIAGARTEHPLGRLACVLYRGWERLDWSPPPVDPSWLKANDATVLRVARAIREEQRFGDLPVLADALEEAGCSDVEILDHCRRPVLHQSGCYVLDALLGVRPDWSTRTWSPPDSDSGGASPSAVPF